MPHMLAATPARPFLSRRSNSLVETTSKKGGRSGEASGEVLGKALGEAEVRYQVKSYR